MTIETKSRLRTVGQLLGSSETIYTCPTGFDSEIQTFHINNLNTAAVDLTVKAVITSTDIPIVTTKSIAADAIVDLLNSRPIALKASDTIVATAGTTNSLNIVLTVSETFIG
tara:strand:- start:1595 stop:1930 length:336 start_codon:yes stop_codon:yes gene_type:complete